jgi:putative cardiolipin synthase
VILLGALSACASVDFDYPKEENFALPQTSTSDTYLGSLVTKRVAEHPSGESGFAYMFDGIDALAARFILTSKAEKTIDAQYYLITNDTVGFLFIGSLLKAADRGVRVRLLLDDIQTKGYDVGFAALDSHPNFEVRIFNPFAGRGSRVGDGLTDFGRINRRMHNKSFTIDSQVTIVGGRNIADEYFGAHKDVNFGDVDVFGAGPIAQDVSTMFDTYWNDVAAAPVPAFAKMPDDPALALEQLRAKIEDVLEAAKASKYGEAVTAEINRYLEGRGEQLTWAPYELVYDSPEKADKKKAAEAESIVTSLTAAIARAETELIVISPYFVPRKKGIAYFQSLIDRGLSITVITNSLAANNHAIVHSGYVSSRKPLLKMGVNIYEIKTKKALRGLDRGGSGASLATLHSKAFVVDRKEIFVGSFNWDPRSVKINTELGVIIKSQEMSSFVGEMIDAGKDERAYMVILNDKGQVRWVDNEGPEPVILDKEPDTTWWRRTKMTLGRAVPIRGQL